jgi:hypothetical protein
MTTVILPPNHTFCTNGNSAVPQLNEFDVEHKADGSYIKPRGSGAVTGWVHIPVPCPIQLAKYFGPRVIRCAVTVATSSNAKVDKFYCTIGTGTVFQKENWNFQSQFGGLEVKSFDENDGLAHNARVIAGPCISLELKFEASSPNERGFVWINSANVELVED